MDKSLGPHFRRREWLLALLASLGACGGVDSGGTGTGQAPPTLSVGPITGFGSVIVNGVRYDDSAATIEDDEGRMIARSQLKLGMQAVVLASAISTSADGVASASASSVAVRSDIIGPIEAIDRALGVLTVLGQQVAIVPATVFDEGLVMGLAALAEGDVVEVHGDIDAAAARVVASRIDRVSNAARYKLRGRIGALSLSTRTFTIGAALIDWSAMAPVDPGTALAPGQVVRVTLATAPVAGVWRATSLSTARPVLQDRERVELEGRISALTSSTRFEVNGFVVDASTASFPSGSAGLVLGAKVEVVGSARGGVLVAQRVKLKSDDGDGFELHGAIESIDTAARRFVVRAVTVNWNDATRFDSSSAADIRTGREVEVRGRLSADGTQLEATQIHVER
jgi:hypothetical protein